MRGEPDGAAFVAQQETIGSRSRFPAAGEIADAIECTPKAQRREKPPYGFVAIVAMQAKNLFFPLHGGFVSKPLPLRHPRRAEGV